VSKLGQIIRKNLLLLVRNRSSAFVILFGPLFIILLIGLAFSNSSTGDFIVGYYDPGHAELTQKFVLNLEEDGFVAQSYPDLTSCIEAVKIGTLQTCIAFPADFSIADNKTNNIIFYVDQSRTNFVYQIIDSISKNLGVATAKLSEDLTENILRVLWSTDEGVNDAIENVIVLRANVAAIEKDIGAASEGASDIDFEGAEVDTDEVEGYFDTMTLAAEDLRSEVGDFMNAAEDLQDYMETNGFNASVVLDFYEAMEDMDNYTDLNEEAEEVTIENFDTALADMITALDEVNEKLSSAEESNEEVIVKITSVQKSAEKVRNDLNELKLSLEKMSTTINSLKVTSSATISNPITTSIEPISSNNNKLVFMFPYLLMLVVMFVGLLLSGTLVMMEKNSKASFRTFCTPVKDELLMMGNFLTSFIVLLFQVGIIVGIAYYFLGDVLIGNIPVAASILFLGMVFFITLGMAIGYLLSSQESVTMISISLGSIALFLSNLILPLETLSRELQKMTMFNPYVITSEALRKALVFNTSHVILQKEILTLILYSVIVFCLLIIVRHVVQSDFYSKLHLRRRKIFEDPSDMYLKIADLEIKSLKEFAAWLEEIDEKTFKEEFIWKDFRDWMKHNHMSRSLRVRLAGAPRARMIILIKKHIDKVRKA
jgi:ABC-type Na+ efflux pump permease subunit